MTDDVLMSQALDRYVLVTFAARIAGRPQRTVRTWAARGQIRVRRVDGHVLVHVNDVVRQSSRDQWGCLHLL